MLSIKHLQAENLQREFTQNGYIILRSFCTQPEVDALLTEFQALEGDRSNNLNKGAMIFHSTLYAQSHFVKAFISQPKIVDLLTSIVGSDIWVRWDQAVAKGPGAGTFPWHQDNGYTRLKDPHYQFWIALTRMTAENGGLWLQPGSHHHRSLPHTIVGNHAVYQGTPESPILIEAQPGDVVLFSSYTLHSTTPNTTQETRWAYVVEYMSTHHYDPGIQPPYLLISQNGRPQPEYVSAYPGSRNPLNRLKYVGHKWSLRRFVPGWAKGFKQRLIAQPR
jgi:ectoine hydroxylase-related dioxygenase (phytanoyl-CoA dioxygenase family)